MSKLCSLSGLPYDPPNGCSHPMCCGGRSSKSTTPKSDYALELWDEFQARVKQRLETGKRVYGDSSFERSLNGIAEEIRQEVLDVVGWAFILYSRLNELERRIDAGNTRGPLDV